MRWLVVGVTVWIAACHDSARGRGSEACREWQDALCTYAADRCGAMTREDCDAQYRGITCKSDAIASECAAEFDAARCGFAPARCDLDGVADPAPAMQACQRLFAHLCERAVECSAFESVEDCTSSEAVQAIDCSRAIAYSLRYESCYDTVQAIACGDLADELRLPPGCSDVITLSQ